MAQSLNLFAALDDFEDLEELTYAVRSILMNRKRAS
jgi:hypothetical protein